jgi:hypothetical protein
MGFQRDGHFEGDHPGNPLADIDGGSTISKTGNRPDQRKAKSCSIVQPSESSKKTGVSKPSTSISMLTPPKLTQLFTAIIYRKKKLRSY